MSVDPRARMRVQTVSVRPSLQKELGNQELLALFIRSLGLSVAGTTRERFENQVREAIRYFTHPDGREIPVREWTKEEVWGYVHYAESSYCANFIQVCFSKPVRRKWSKGCSGGVHFLRRADVSHDKCSHDFPKNFAQHYPKTITIIL